MNKLTTFLAAILLSVQLHAAPLVSGLPDFSQLVAKVQPSVVTIVVTIPEPTVDQFDGELPPFLFGPPAAGSSAPSKPRIAHGEGSGFIVSSDGLILTNDHVVSGATSITVYLPNGREYKAKLIGTDYLSDVAVIKIDATNLPAVPLGHSSSVVAGQWVIAIGAPFGFDGTVGAGIVSMVGRNLADNPFTPFIQTTVPINHGNSGGPLFNLDGEVVGINSQIYSGTGDWAGIAFSIPIDDAVDVEHQLLQNGHVTRGRVGVSVMNVTQSIADTAGLDRPRGGAIMTIDRNGPSASSGLKVGDIVLAVNNHAVEKSTQLPVLISRLKPDSVVTFNVWRDKKLLTIDVKVAEMKQQKAPVERD